MAENVTKNHLFASFATIRFFNVSQSCKDFGIIRSSILFLAIIFSIVILSIVLIVVALSNKSIYIGSGLQTRSFQEENLSSIMEDNKVEYFFKNSEKLTIDSKKVESKNSNFAILMQNDIITPHLNGKIYKGFTERMFWKAEDNRFTIPEPLQLNNNDKNYIKTLELHGYLDKEIISDLYFEAMEGDKFISGDNLYYDVNKDFFKISQNAHIYQINDNAKYDVKSQRMELFNQQNVAEFSKNVVFTNKKETLYCDFARLFFDNQHKITDIFFRGHIIINQADNKITAKYGFFDKNQHMMLLYNDVVLTSTNGSSTNKFYFYDTENKTGFSFNENTKNKTIDQTGIYSILYKMSDNLPKKHRAQILRIVKNNKKYQLRRSNKKGENYNIDRNKRVKINMVEK